MNTTSIGDVKITYFGHSSVLLEGAQMSVFVDPFAPAKLQKAVDIVLHTHSHFDHCDEGKTEKVAKFSTVVAGTNCRHPCRLLKIGEQVKIGNVVLVAVPAYNIGKPYHPRDANGAGYIIAIGSTRVYVAGDTDEIPEMKKFKCDVAIVPIGGKYTMDAREAAIAIAKIKPRVAIPVHYNYLDDTKADPVLFRQLVQQQTEGKTEVRILTP